MLSIKMKRKNYRIFEIISFLLFLILPYFANAQPPKLEFSTLKGLETISNSNVSTIAQDSTGFIWIGTEEGLFRFDGQAISIYMRNGNEHKSLPSNRINKLFTDSEKKLWVCTRAGICIYDPEFDHFSPIVVENDTKGMAGFDISVIAEDQAGQIFTAYGNSVYVYDRSQNRFSKVVELPKGKITALAFDQQNNIWIAASSNGGLHYFDRKRNQTTTFVNDPENKQSISNNEINDIAIVNNNLWIATYGGGIDLYSLNDKTFKHYISPEYFENFGTRIFTDKEKNIWVCTLGSLKLFVPSTDNFLNYYHQPDNPKSLGKSLTGIFEDTRGNYWAYHSIGGVKISSKKNRFIHFNTKQETFFYLSDANITSISVDGLGHMWAGNYFNGVDVFRWDERKVERFIHRQNDKGSLGNGTIFSIFRDSENQMWVGSYLGGLQKFIPGTKSFESYIHNSDDARSIACNDVRSIAEDKNGNIWVAVHGKGVERFDPKSKTFHHFNAGNNQLSNDYTFQLLCDSRENLWVATAWGLSLLRKGETIFKNFITDKTDSSSISSNDIHSICEDNNQNIWVSTSDGLNKFDWQSQTFKRYSSGLANTHIVSLLCDQKNNIWMGTNAGISKFDQNTQLFTNFDQSDGLLSKGYNDRAAYKGSGNELFFGGTEGVDVFNPDSLYSDAYRPDVVLTDFKLFNRSFTYRDDSTVIRKHINYAEKIVLNYYDNSFAFSFRAINFTQPDKITYAFKLDGFDDDWVYSGNKTEANYTNLRPGKYTFCVKAKYGNGEWSKNEKSIRVNIVPKWWMTTWFKILVILVVLTVSLLIVYWRIKQMRDLQTKLEKLVTERTNEILAKNELLKIQALTLEQKNDQLRDLNSTKDKLFSVISHDLRSPFNAILGFQDMLINSYDEFTDEERLNMISQVNTTTNQVYELVENLLIWAKIQTSSIKHRPVEFPVKGVILEKIDLYRNIAEAKGISFSHQIPDELAALADINLMSTTIRNLINNSIKFTPNGGTIMVKAKQITHSIKISVTDSGTGMTEEQIDSLFNLEKTRSKDGTNGEKGSGLGLILCKEFVEKNRGTLTVESKPGRGSTFSFTIPAAPKK